MVCLNYITISNCVCSGLCVHSFQNDIIKLLVLIRYIITNYRDKSSAIGCDYQNIISDALYMKPFVSQHGKYTYKVMRCLIVKEAKVISCSKKRRCSTPTRRLEPLVEIPHSCGGNKSPPQDKPLLKVVLYRSPWGDYRLNWFISLFH